MNLEEIRTLLQDFIESKKHKLFDVEYHKGDQTLTVLLDEKLNMDELESISGEISSFLDQYEDKMPDNYLRPIRNEKELMEALGEYIYVKTKDKEYYGTFTSYNNGVMNLKVKEKTREKDVSVNYQDTKKVRYAVEF